MVAAAAAEASVWYGNKTVNDIQLLESLAMIRVGLAGMRANKMIGGMLMDMDRPVSCGFENGALRRRCAAQDGSGLPGGHLAELCGQQRREEPVHHRGQMLGAGACL